MPLAPRKEKKFHVEWLAGAAWARCATPRARAPACIEALAMSCSAACACAMSSDSTTHLRYAAARCCCAQCVCGVCAACVQRRKEGGRAGQEVAHSTAAAKLPPDVVSSTTSVPAPSGASCRARVRARVRVRLGVQVGVRGGVRVGVRARMAVRLRAR